MSKRNLKQDVIDAVYVIAAETGLENTTVRRVGERVKATEANIYYHFKNKEELFECAFFAINREIDEELRRFYVENHFDLQKDAKETSINIWFAYLDYWVAHPQKTIFYDYYSHSHYATDEIWAKQSASFAFFTALFQGMLKSLWSATDIYTYALNWSIIIDSTISLAKREFKTGMPIGQSTKDNMRKILINFLDLQNK